ncbi:Sphingoid long-chain base transporter RSB1 [Colletotrichum orbiculare MAFF 240422]|uniref:Sphingoid long-chain base transporter RSB1 n=1 Tax=Colletotrichum orbiculare (strain 104-T / ATCC 96160 / CBS 514.97 / LARS 414 / MAFF 240422) TaxID=1213857 RepID=N4V820_COLOR|nr:Sphingoid long-chain base transporter RSB1 [Colletotrichum orbiculare MAFF 240422]
MTGDCTRQTCPFAGGFTNYSPSAVGSGVFLAAFALLVPLTLYQGYRFKTPLFASTLATGILLEVLGFAGRLRLRDNVASEASFALLLLGTVLGPTLMAAALCQVLPHIVALYGLGIGFTRPRVAGLVLVFALLLVVALEIAGVVAAVFGLGGVQTTTILLSGLGVQAVTLLLFLSLYVCYARKMPDPKHIAVYQAARFKHFIKMLPTVAVVLIGQTIYRLVEYGEGLAGPLARTEAASLVISGALPLLVCAVMCFYHPGAAFGRAWGLTSPRFRSGSLRLRRQGPSPLQSPTAPWDKHKGPRQPGFTASRFPEKNMSPVGVGPVPLRDSTMASKVVATSPGERSVTYPSPIAESHRLSYMEGGHRPSPTFPKGQQAANRNSKGSSQNPMVNSEELW